MSFANLPPSADQRVIEPFTIDISQERIDELQRLVTIGKVAIPTFENSHSERKYGMTRDWLLAAQQYWTNTFDWRKVEKQLNTFPHFQATIDENDSSTHVHFVALFSNRSDAVPVISNHGWPGSFLEYIPQLSLIRSKYDATTLPFHIIIPSLPGFAFSSLPSSTVNFRRSDAAVILHNLMVRALGFSQYLTTGGDIGSFISRQLACTQQACRGMQVNYIGLRKPPISAPPTSTLTTFEQSCIARGAEFVARGSAYAWEQGTRPATLGLVLSSSPLALLAWLGEKFLEWTDEDPSMESCLQFVTLYWLTDTIPRSFYHYRQALESDDNSATAEHKSSSYTYTQTNATASEVSSLEKSQGKVFGYQLLPGEINPAPRCWAETTGHLTWFRQYDRGGHFAALEMPAETLLDLESFVRHAVDTGAVKLNASG